MQIHIMFCQLHTGQQNVAVDRYPLAQKQTADVVGS